MILSRLELRVAEALYDSLYGGLVSSASRGHPFRVWLSARVAQAGFEVACGVRLALLVVLVAPLLVLPGWRTFLGRDSRGQNAALSRLAEANNYAARQLLVMLKALFGLFAGHDAVFAARTHGPPPRRRSRLIALTRRRAVR